VSVSDRWTAAPSEARWYGEAIGSHPGADVDFVYGYSADEDEPDIVGLVPEGWTVDESSVRPTPNHPDWVPDEQKEF
jgi:hypothetical protein